MKKLKELIEKSYKIKEGCKVMSLQLATDTLDTGEYVEKTYDYNNGVYVFVYKYEKYITPYADEVEPILKERGFQKNPRMYRFLVDSFQKMILNLLKGFFQGQKCN